MQFEIIADETDDDTEPVAPGTSCCPLPPLPGVSPSYCPLP